MGKLQTQIIATIGPATLDPVIFNDLYTTGIDYIRINTSYGNTEQYDMILANHKAIDQNATVKVLFDIKSVNILPYALKNNITTIAVSFAENASQISDVRNRIPKAFVIAKIETRAGVLAFDELLEASDGIMIARGDLGEAVTLEKVPPLQKEFTRKTIAQRKYLITATEMLLSMVEHNKPTRAEVSDVANAVFDYSSAVMLSEETAIGKHPVEALTMTHKTIAVAEKWKYQNIIEI